MNENQNHAFPNHWIGIRKGWECTCQSLGQALVELPTSRLKTHALVIGATGSGKTTLLHHLMAQDILTGHSFAVLDMRGDLVAAALELCAGRVDPTKVALFDLREREKPLGFNPLHGSGEAYFRALGVLDVIASESDSWGVQLAETLRNAVMLLAESKAPLTNLEAVFYKADIRRQYVQACTSESVSSFWERYDGLSADRQAALAMPVINKVSLLLATESLRRTLGNPQPIDLGEHLNTRGSITLVSLAVDELHAAGRMMGSLLLSSICREVFSRVHIPEAKRNPVRLYVDEFEHFGTKEFENILAEGRRFGLSLILAHQTLAQLNPKVRSMILNNVGTKVVFRTGREDGATLSKDITGDAKTYDFCSLPVGEAVLWTRGIQPFLVEINAPLFSDLGARSHQALKFLTQLKDNIPDFGTHFLGDVTRRELPPNQTSQHKPNPPKSLEDWL